MKYYWDKMIIIINFQQQVTFNFLSTFWSLKVNYMIDINFIEEKVY